jgi:hypothetical protein
VSNVTFILNVCQQPAIDTTSNAGNLSESEQAVATEQLSCLDEMEQHNWAIRLFPASSSNESSPQAQSTCNSVAHIPSLRRDSVMSVTEASDYFHFNGMDMSNWMFGPMYGP